MLKAIVPAVVGILILISGIINLSETITIHKQNGEGVLLSLILSLITVALGILIILKPSVLNNIILVLMGFSLIYDGVSNLIIIAGITGMVHEARKEYAQAKQDAAAIDTTGGYTEVGHQKSEEVPPKTTAAPTEQEPKEEPKKAEKS